MSPVQLLIHLGDAEGYEDYIGELCGCPFEIVSGNNDFFFASAAGKSNYGGKISCFFDARALLLCRLRSGGPEKRSKSARCGHRHVWPYAYAYD